jgi:hypothetical protein
MKEEKKKVRTPSDYTRRLIEIVAAYSAETSNTDVDLNLAAAWAYSKGLMEPQRMDVIKQMARSLAHACRQDYVEDENGDPVRMRHPYRVKNGEKQQVFWFAMDATTPEKMRMSYQQNRKGLAAEVSQRHRDINHYNKHFNPGDPIVPDWNFNADMAEQEHSGEYDDTPPPEEET